MSVNLCSDQFASSYVYIRLCEIISQAEKEKEFLAINSIEHLTCGVCRCLYVTNTIFFQRFYERIVTRHLGGVWFKDELDFVEHQRFAGTFAFRVDHRITTAGLGLRAGGIVFRILQALLSFGFRGLIRGVWRWRGRIPRSCSYIYTEHRYDENIFIAQRCDREMSVILPQIIFKFGNTLSGHFEESSTIPPLLLFKDPVAL